jgi:acetolactate synthase-1/2/3 large subunit
MSAVVSSLNPVTGSMTADDTFRQLAEMPSGHGDEVCDPAQIAHALQRAREAMHRAGGPAIMNIRVGLGEYAPGTENQNTYR